MFSFFVFVLFLSVEGSEKREKEKGREYLFGQHCASMRGRSSSAQNVLPLESVEDFVLSLGIPPSSANRVLNSKNPIVQGYSLNDLMTKTNEAWLKMERGEGFDGCNKINTNNT